jgi:uncharacterized protein DUF4386
MTDRVEERSPLFKARLAGVFYLLNIVMGAFAAFSLGRGLVTVGDTEQIIATFCYIVVTLLFYGLFKPVNSSLSLIAALFSLVGCAVGILSLFQVAPIVIDDLVFFGVYCLLIGYLILKSTFLPRTLGVLMVIAGLAWLTFLSRPLAHSLSPFIFLPGMIGEGSLTVWLLVMGVNAQRWNEQAGITGTSVHA